MEEKRKNIDAFISTKCRLGTHTHAHKDFIKDFFVVKQYGFEDAR